MLPHARYLGCRPQAQRPRSAVFGSDLRDIAAWKAQGNWLNWSIGFIYSLRAWLASLGHFTPLIHKLIHWSMLILMPSFSHRTQQTQRLTHCCHCVGKSESLHKTYPQSPPRHIRTNMTWPSQFPEIALRSESFYEADDANPDNPQVVSTRLAGLKCRLFDTRTPNDVIQ